MTSLDRIQTEVLEEITPGQAERDRLEAVTDTLTDRAADAIEALAVDATVTRVGSTARGTWLAGDRDIDLFIQFPPALSRDELESYGLKIGHTVLPDGHEEYAEHPYVKGEYEGFDIDLVPCYAVSAATEIQSAVDRTPFHNAYLQSKLTDEQKSDVRVAKRFLKAIGAYGSDLKTKGFSGYLTELLIIEYGDFRSFIQAAAAWRPPVVHDPENHSSTSFDDPLVVIDPTDPERNVAAVLSAENVARVQHYARQVQSTPHIDLFFPEPTEPLSTEQFKDHLRQRETTLIGVVFDTPTIVEDQLYPQLEKSRNGIVAALNRHGFGVLRSMVAAETESLILVELTTRTLPAIERHVGPPVHVRSHAEGFFNAYIDDESVYGPFLDGDRYVVERPRSCRDAVSLLESEMLFDVGLGTHVQTALEERYRVLVDEELTELCSPFGTTFAEYFAPHP